LAAPRGPRARACCPSKGLVEAQIFPELGERRPRSRSSFGRAAGRLVLAAVASKALVEAEIFLELAER
jgi:hypothetical protein